MELANTLQKHPIGHGEPTGRTLPPSIVPARRDLQTPAHESNREMVATTFHLVVLHFGSFAKNIAVDSTGPCNTRYSTDKHGGSCNGTTWQTWHEQCSEGRIVAAFEQLASRFDQYLLRLHRNGDTQRGMIVFDEAS